MICAVYCVVSKIKIGIKLGRSVIGSQDFDLYHILIRLPFFVVIVVVVIVVDIIVE